LAAISKKSELDILRPTSPLSLVQFHGDALVLSGVTGTRLKCDILAAYYPTWWEITSGGSSRNNRLATAIVEMNAGSGEDYIEETHEVIPGSSGHALKLKLETPNASNLKVILVEENDECYSHLKAVITRTWPALDLTQTEGPPQSNRTGIYLLHKDLNDALDTIEQFSLGNTIFFFDPLLFTPWSVIERVARRRIKWYYQIGTEFIVFMFTSDWFTGRAKLNLSPLPKTPILAQLSEGERETVGLMNEMFGNEKWQSFILNDSPTKERVARLVEQYRLRLHRWFRYVLPLPFEPKTGQTYHLFMCSNYEEGIDITRRFYTKYSKNQAYSPDNATAYANFCRAHPLLVSRIHGRRRPLEWRFLWAVIKNHEEGLCDIECQDFVRIEGDWRTRLGALQWLESKGYLRHTETMTDAWEEVPPLYKADWGAIKQRLGVDSPPALIPLSPTQVSTLKDKQSS
jgi:three-Cys-motif partner protein